MELQSRPTRDLSRRYSNERCGTATVSSTPKLSVVVPCYNEEKVLNETIPRLNRLLDHLVEQHKISSESYVYYVDDGSRDATWEIIRDRAASDDRVRGIKLSQNRGHQNALFAGLATVGGDIVVSVDADLQDDLNAIGDMVEAFLAGHDIVYGVRSVRNTDTRFKRVTAETYYRLLELMGVNVVYNHADFRLLSRRALEALKQFQEVNLFLRGIVPALGFSSTVVSYERRERFAGDSKYPVRKMLGLAIDGITSFSALPLRIIAGLGFVVFMASLLVSVWVLWVRLFTANAVPGWASSVLPMYLLGGIQLLSIGVLGEYVGKIYLETKRRPRFFIEERL